MLNASSLAAADAVVAADCPHRLRHAVMVQRWSDVVFLHWRCDPQIVQALLPPGLTVDCFDGSAWVGLVPFRMEGLGFPGLAPLPLVGAFAEVNVRTYVRQGERRGVWFLSLDVDRSLPAAVARFAYHLPYCVGRASHVRSGDVLSTQVQRRWPRAGQPATAGATTDLVVRAVGDAAPDDPLSRFLTARWGLYSATRRGRLRYAPVDHQAWPLRHGEVLRLDDDLVTTAGFPHPEGEPHVLWSPGVDVRIGWPTPATAAKGPRP